MIPASNLHARRSSRLPVLLAGAALAVSALACGPGGGPADGLLVLHTASAYGYFEDCGCRYDSTGGLAKRAWVIDSLQRASDVPTLLVDAGDFSGGDNAYGAELGRVMVEAMDVIGYDAMTFGEWDLNQGTAYLREVVTGSSIAWVHTNYDVVGLEDLGHETLVVEKGGRRIGLIGLFNPTILLDAAMRDSVSVDQDVAASAARAVADLEERGVDAIVVLSHLSYQADRVLAREVEGIELIVSGHGGKSLVGAEEATPDTWIVAPGDLGRFLGRALLSFEATDGEAAHIAAVDAELIVMEPGLPDDPRIEPLLERYEERRKTMVESDLGG